MPAERPSFLKLVDFKEEEIIGKYTYDFTPAEEGTYESTTGKMIEINEKYFNDTKTMLEKLFEEGKIENRESYLSVRIGKWYPLRRI